jgi:hypothetical protein
MENKNNDDLMFTPEKEKKSPLMRYAAIGVIGIALLGDFLLFWRSICS